MSCIIVFGSSNKELISNELIDNSLLGDVEIINITSEIENFSIINEILPKAIIIDINYEFDFKIKLSEKLKSNEELKYIPIIVIVAENENENIISRYTELGVEFVLKKSLLKQLINSQLKVLFEICQYKQNEIFTNFEDDEENEKSESSLEIFGNLYKIIEDITDLIFVLSKHGEIIDLSDQSLKFLGYKRKDLLGKKISDISISQDFKVVKNIVDRIKDKLKDSNCEFTIKKKDGTLLVIQWIVNVFVDKSGVERVYFAGKNITHDRIIDRELSKRERDFKSIFENSTDAIYIQDKNGVFIDVNPGAEKMYGYSHEELIGKSPDFVSAPGRNNIDEVYEKFNKAYNGNSQQLEFWGRRRNGEIFPKLVSLTNGSYFGQDVVITFAIDITDRKLAEDAVRKSEEKYRLIVNNTKDVIWKIDLNKNFTYISPAVEKLTGYTQEEYLKFSLNECMADKDLENMDRVLSGEMNKIMQGKFDELLDSYVIDVTVFHKEGRNIICEMKAFLVFDKNQVVGIQGIISDITKRKEDEKKLRESENRFVSFMNYLPSLVFIKHEKGEYVYTNKYYNDFFGDNVDVIGKSSSDIFSDDISENIKTNDIEVLNKGIRILEQEINGNDNKQHIFKTYKFPILLEDKTKLIGGFAIDITKEKKAELIQQVVYNISNAVNIEYNEKDFFSIIQQELSKLIDTKNFYIAVYNIEKDIIELPYMDDERMNYSIAPNDSATAYVIRTKKALLAKQKDIERFEQQGKFKMRGLISKIWLGVPLKSDKKVIGMIGVQSYSNENQYNNKDKKILEIVATQIGFFIERKRANQELVKAKEKAEESDKLKSVFLANMSHEIRTPMNGMIGFAEMLKLKGLSEEKRDNFIDIINQSGHQLLTIINDIIDVSKIEANQIKLNKKNIPVNKLIEEVNSLFLKNKELKAKGLKLLCKLPDNECNIYTDEVRLKQILSNLVSNAIKFTPKGVIEFGYEITNSMLKFFVKDTGIGIHEKDKKIIFKRFRQIDEGSTRKYGGTGIGLAICKELVEMLDGEIWLKPNSPNGSIFYFTIPNISGELKNDTKVRKANTKTVIPNSKLKILIAEDDQFNFELLEYLIELENMEVVRAENGNDAVDIVAADEDIDIVLMDIKMPEKDGYSASHEIKKIRPNLPIIAQTAYSMEGDKEKALQAGCDAYIAKPIIPKKLLKVIKQYI